MKPPRTAVNDQAPSIFATICTVKWCSLLDKLRAELLEKQQKGILAMEDMQ